MAKILFWVPLFLPPQDKPLLQYKNEFCLFSGKAACWWNCSVLGWGTICLSLQPSDTWFSSEFIRHQKKKYPNEASRNI